MLSEPPVFEPPLEVTLALAPPVPPVTEPPLPPEPPAASVVVPLVPPVSLAGFPCLSPPQLRQASATKHHPMICRIGASESHRSSAVNRNFALLQLEVLGALCLRPSVPSRESSVGDRERRERSADFGVHLPRGGPRATARPAPCTKVVWTELSRGRCPACPQRQAASPRRDLSQGPGTRALLRSTSRYHRVPICYAGPEENAFARRPTGEPAARASSPAALWPNESSICVLDGGAKGFCTGAGGVGTTRRWRA